MEIDVPVGQTFVQPAGGVFKCKSFGVKNILRIMYIASKYFEGMFIVGTLPKFRDYIYS